MSVYLNAEQGVEDLVGRLLGIGVDCLLRVQDVPYSAEHLRAHHPKLAYKHTHSYPTYKHTYSYSINCTGYGGAP